jgi:DNA-binding NtrC family response regulator
VKHEDSLIVVIDDEDLIRTWLCEKLQSAGYPVEKASTGAEGRHLVETSFPALVLLDLRLPDADGIELLKEFHDADRDLIVIIVTAYGEIDTAVEAVKAGAYDFVEKPVEFDALLLTVEKALETRRLRRQVAVFQEQHRWHFAHIELVGRSEAMREVVTMVEKVAAAESTAILLTGESGTGKDLVARAIHAHSPRADQPFLEINCSALPENLVESELFGHERGAFTDARARKQGLAELADGGTLFLDEVGDMPMAAQAKVLRFLEDSRFKRIGGTADIRVDARVIAATNHNLEGMVRDGTFRSDLFFRLNVVPIHIPPLRDRREDIAPLALFFIEQLSADLKREPATLTEPALEFLEKYSWPGNVRELRNVLERVLILGATGAIRSEDVPVEIREPLPTRAPGAFLCELPPEGLRMEEVERDLMQQALARTSGNVTRAADLLGLSRDTLRYRLQKYSHPAPAATPESRLD